MKYEHIGWLIVDGIDTVLPQHTLVSDTSICRVAGGYLFPMVTGGKMSFVLGATGDGNSTFVTLHKGLALIHDYLIQKSIKWDWFSVTRDKLTFVHDIQSEDVVGQWIRHGINTRVYPAWHRGRHSFVISREGSFDVLSFTVGATVLAHHDFWAWTECADTATVWQLI